MDDLRVPIGTFFAIVGVILIAMSGAHSPLTEAPVNLYAGLSMLVFGAVMLWLAYRGSRTGVPGSK